MQILINLLSNAIKFTSDNGSITFDVYLKDNKYCIQIADTGIGISEEDIKLISQPFTNPGRSPLVSYEKGSGLGLSIAKSLIDLHGGKLEIESVLGDGTEVTVVLPLQGDHKPDYKIN